MQPKPQLRVQSIGDVDLEYLYYDGPGPAIVCLHATGFNPWMWHPIARELCKTHKVIAPYFCDHRHTDPDKGGMSWLLLAEDLASFCKQLVLDRPLLIGHSMGGTVITFASTLYGLSPAAMILIEPIFLPEVLYQIEKTVANHPLASKSIKRRNNWPDEAAAREYLRSKPLFENWDEEMLDLYIRYGMTPEVDGGLSLTCSPVREASLFLGSYARNPWPLLPQVIVPVLVVEGETSENRQFIDLPKIAELFPKGKYLKIEGAGHLAPMEKPEQTTAVIRDFIGTV